MIASHFNFASLLINVKMLNSKLYKWDFWILLKTNFFVDDNWADRDALLGLPLTNKKELVEDVEVKASDHEAVEPKTLKEMRKIASRVTALDLGTTDWLLQGSAWQDPMKGLPQRETDWEKPICKNNIFGM